MLKDIYSGNRILNAGIAADDSKRIANSETQGLCELLAIGGLDATCWECVGVFSGSLWRVLLHVALFVFFLLKAEYDNVLGSPGVVACKPKYLFCVLVDNFYATFRECNLNFLW